MNSPCLDCGTPTPRTRCAICQRNYERRRGGPAERGYDATYRKRRAEVIAAEPWCHTKGGCPYPDPGTHANPLTADHVIPIAKGGRDGPLTVLCRSCNSSKRDRTDGGGSSKSRRA